MNYLLILSLSLGFQCITFSMLVTQNILALRTIIPNAKEYSTVPFSREQIQEKVTCYEKTRDKDIVMSIAKTNQKRLSSYATNDPIMQTWFEESIRSTLDDQSTICKVYLIDNKPIGFISYTIAYSWYRKYFSNIIGPNADIHHLAIDDSYQGKGYGTTLLKGAIEDCKKQSVYKITLMTTDWALNGYYPRFGFDIKRTSKYVPEQTWELRLDRRSLKELVKDALAQLYQSKNE